MSDVSLSRRLLENSDGNNMAVSGGTKSEQITFINEQQVSLIGISMATRKHRKLTTQCFALVETFALDSLASLFLNQRSAMLPAVLRFLKNLPTAGSHSCSSTFGVALTPGAPFRQL